MKGYSRNKSLGRLRTLAPVFLVVLLGIAALFIAWVFPRFNLDLRRQAVVTPKKIRVLEVKYFPNSGEVSTLRTNSNLLSQQFAAKLSDMSKAKGYKTPTVSPYVQVEFVSTPIERQSLSPDLGTAGNKYDKSYKSLNAILTANNNQICNAIKTQNVDQVWYYFDSCQTANDPTCDHGGFTEEYWWNYSSTIVPSQPAPYPSLCGGTKTFTEISIDMNRQVDVALHAFGHAMEAMLGNIEGTDMFWTRWAGKQSLTDPNSLAKTCGDVHFPPNGTVGDGIGYDYDNTASVNSKCENWKPDGSGTATSISCSRWGCIQEGYLVWWGQNFPNDNNGLTFQGKKIPNWWDFVRDFDTNVKFYTNRNDEWFVNNPWFESNNPKLLLPEYVDNVTKVSQPSSPQYSFNHTTSGANRLLLVAVSYGTQAAGGSVGSIVVRPTGTDSPQNMTLVRKENFQNAKNTEWWYLYNPPRNSSGDSQITITMSGSTHYDGLATAVSIIGASQTAPIRLSPAPVGAGNPNTNTGSTSYSLSVPSATSEVALFAFGSYTESNTINLTSASSRKISDERSTNTLLYIGARKSTSSTTPLSWTSTNDWFWAASGISLMLSSGVASPTPAPTPTTGPLPTVDLKVNGTNGPVTVNDGGSATLSWTSTNATSCVATGDWNGSKSTSGSQVISNLTATFTVTSTSTRPTTDLDINITPGKTSAPKTYTISCANGSNSSSDTVIVNVNYPGSNVTPNPVALYTHTESGGQVSFQAENYSQNIARSTHQWELKTGTSGYTGLGFMRSLPDDGSGGDNTKITTTQAELVYKINFSQTGTYYVWLFGSAPSDASDSVHIGIDGTVPSTSDKLTLIGISSFIWQSATMDGPRPTIAVPSAGLHTLHLYMREDGAKVDQILLTTSSAYKP